MSGKLSAQISPIVIYVDTNDAKLGQLLLYTCDFKTDFTDCVILKVQLKSRINLQKEPDRKKCVFKLIT